MIWDHVYSLTYNCLHEHRLRVLTRVGHFQKGLSALQGDRKGTTFYEGRTESHEQLFFACELGTADEGE